MKGKLAKRIITALTLAAFAAIVAGAASFLKPIVDLEQESYDLRVLAFAPTTTASPDVVMVWLDEATMKGLSYRSPVPRDFLARLHSRIMSAKPRLVGYDIFFKDPSFPEADSAFAEALEGSAAYAVAPMRPDGSVEPTLPLFEKALKGVGLADLPFNPFDSTIRTAKLSFDTKGGRMDSFGAAIFSAATGANASAAVREQADPPGAGPFRATPFVGEDEMFIRFAAPPGVIGGKGNAFKTYSAAMVEKGLVPAAWLADKIVLVGASYEDLKDAYLTPYYAKAAGFARMNGVEIHAGVLSSLLTGRFYYAMTGWQRAAWIFLAALAVGAAAAFLTPVRASLAYAAAVILWVLISAALFARYALVVPVVAPLIAQTVSLGAGLGWRALTEGRQRRFIKGVFARYVPPAVVERMTENPELLKLGGEFRTVTSLFTDIASFTSISERLDPKTLVALLNEYLGLMNEALFRHGGTLDKYEGDAIIAFFNAPLDVADHELAAAMAAIEMRRVDELITAKWKERCGREISTRVGINTGKAVIGNMGSEGRFDYTAIGDTINLASRLEGANKFYGTRIMASESTAGRLGEKIITRPLDRVRVKGKTEPIMIYEIMGVADEMDAARMHGLVEPYRLAFGLFEARKFSQAKFELDATLKIFNDDGPACELASRCDRAMREPGWDLVTDFTTK